MANLKVAILGVSGIGKFHVREFLRAGGDVVAFLGSSEESIGKNIKLIKDEFGIETRGYTDIDELLGKEKLDAVSICVPDGLHSVMIRKALLANLHVMCEKPMVSDTNSSNYPVAKELMDLAKEKRKIITVNTQWSAVLPFFEPYVDIHNVSEFYMYTQPRTAGKGMLNDHLPHKNSVLVKLVPNGKAENIHFDLTSPNEINLFFDYKNNKKSCSVHYKFVSKIDRPRDVHIGINSKLFTRVLGDNYQQKFSCDGITFDIIDPFEISIGKFVRAIEGRDNVLNTPADILDNMRLQDQFIEHYMKL